MHLLTLHQRIARLPYIMPPHRVKHFSPKTKADLAAHHAPIYSCKQHLLPALLSSQLICSTAAFHDLPLLAGKEWLEDSQAAQRPVLP